MIKWKIKLTNNYLHPLNNPNLWEMAFSVLTKFLIIAARFCAFKA